MHDLMEFTVLHPYYKLTYIKHAWGGADEKEAEIEAGNLDAKDWQDEALKIVEKTVSFIARSNLILTKFVDGKLL
jgi:hypothetical protein